MYSSSSTTTPTPMLHNRRRARAAGTRATPLAECPECRVGVGSAERNATQRNAQHLRLHLQWRGTRLTKARTMRSGNENIKKSSKRRRMKFRRR